MCWSSDLGRTAAWLLRMCFCDVLFPPAYIQNHALCPYLLYLTGCFSILICSPTGHSLLHSVTCNPSVGGVGIPRGVTGQLYGLLHLSWSVLIAPVAIPAYCLHACVQHINAVCCTIVLACRVHVSEQHQGHVVPHAWWH